MSLHLISPPPYLTKWADLRTWYTKAVGYIPTNYKERPAICSDTPRRQVLMAELQMLNYVEWDMSNERVCWDCFYRLVDSGDRPTGE